MNIISGTYRGREIATPGGGTHPMGARERLALFNMIADSLPGAVVLDAYAGSGALGIEAISRGAKDVTFVEDSHVAMRTITENCMRLGIKDEKAAFYRGTVGAFYKKIIQGQGTIIHPMMALAATTFPTEFDIIFADPPYDDFRPKVIAKLGTCLKTGGILALSHPGEPPELSQLELEKSRQYAAAHISIYRKIV